MFGGSSDACIEFALVAGTEGPVEQDALIMVVECRPFALEQLPDRWPDTGSRIEGIGVDAVHVGLGGEGEELMQRLASVADSWQEWAEHYRGSQAGSFGLAENFQPGPNRRGLGLPEAGLRLIRVSNGYTEADVLALKDVEVPQNQFALGEYIEAEAGFEQHPAASAGNFVAAFEALPAVTNTAGEDTPWAEPSQLAGEDFGGVDLDIDELSPGLLVGMETLHKTGIAIDAAVGAAGVGVEGVLADRGTIEEAFTFDLANNEALASISSWRRGLLGFFEQTWMGMLGHWAHQSTGKTTVPEAETLYQRKSEEARVCGRDLGWDYACNQAALT